jgi:hypothetical protein
MGKPFGDVERYSYFNLLLIRAIAVSILGSLSKKRRRKGCSYRNALNFTLISDLPEPHFQIYLSLIFRVCLGSYLIAIELATKKDF